MLVTYNFVTKSEQGHLTTGNMLRMLISGGIFIKHTDVPTVFFESEIFAWLRSKISIRSRYEEGLNAFEEIYVCLTMVPGRFTIG